MRTVAKGLGLLAASTALVMALYWSPRCDFMRSDDLTWIRAVEYQPFWRMAVGQFAHGSPFDYRPLTSVALWLEANVFGDRSYWYYAVNFLLHGANAILAAMIGRRLGVERLWALLAGLLFLVHPAPFRTIVWIADIATILQTTFTLCAVLCWLHYFKSGRLPFYVAAIVCAVAAMFTKESGIAAVALLPVLDFLFRPAKGLRRLAMYVVLAAVLAVYLRLSLQPLPGWREYPQVYHLGWHMFWNALYGIGFAITPEAGITVTVIAGALCATAVAIIFPGRRAGIFVAAWILIAVIPTSPFEPDGYDDTGRYVYSLLCPLALTGGMVFQRGYLRAISWRPGLPGFAAIAIPALSLLGFAGSATYRLARTPYTTRPGVVLYHYVVFSVLGYDRAEQFLQREFNCSETAITSAREWSARFVHDRGERREFLLTGLLAKGISEAIEGDAVSSYPDFDKAVELVSNGKTVDLARGVTVRAELVRTLASRWHHDRTCPGAAR